MKLYDPRKDDTVAGGSGPQRWNEPLTWSSSTNPVVMIYNIRRGITLENGEVWGYQAPADRLPLANWIAAMNECEVLVQRAEGGYDYQYEAGIEIKAGPQELGGDSPIDIEQELLKACSGEIVDVGGDFKIRVGAPSMPVLFITDDDLIVTRPEEYAPFPGLNRTHNGIAANYPEPEALYEPKPAPTRYNAAWEAEDGGRRLMANVQLSAVTSVTQVQRLMQAWINDDRRWRTHIMSLGPSAAILEPLDAIQWDSDWNGYTDKLFEVRQQADDPMSLLQGVTVRERDPSDYDWTSADEEPVLGPAPFAPVPLPYPVIPTPRAVPIYDDSSNERRPGVEITWDATGLELVDAIHWQIRPAGSTEIVAEGSTTNVMAGAVTVSEGIVASTSYEVRLYAIADVPREWSAWAPVTSGDIRLGVADLDDTVQATVAPAVPAVPAGLALTSTLLSDGRAKMTASWSSVAAATGYEVRLKEGAGNWISFPTSETEYSWDTLPGIGFTAEVRAINKTVQSAYSASVAHTTAADSVAPAVPTGLAITAGFGVLWLEWANNTEGDFSHYEIYEHMAATPAPSAGTTATFSATGNQMAREGLGDGVQRWYWIRAVDTSGNASAWSASVNATTVAELTADRLVSL